MKRILAIGNVYNGLYANTPSLHALSGESLGSSYNYAPCGGTLKAAHAMAAYNSEVMLCGRVGSDHKAKNVVACIGLMNISTRFIKSTPNSKTGLIIHLNEDCGTERRIVFPESNLTLSAFDIENAFTCFPDALYIRGDISNELLKEAFSRASNGNKNIDIFYQPSKKEGLLPANEVPHLTALLLDGDEVRYHCDIDVNRFDVCLNAAIKLSHIYNTDYIVIRMPERCTYIYDGKYQHSVETFHTARKDAIGCREIFGGAMCSHFMDKRDIVSAVRIGNIAYGIAADKGGDMIIPPNRNEIHEYINKNDIKF